MMIVHRNRFHKSAGNNSLLLQVTINRRGDRVKNIPIQPTKKHPQQKHQRKQDTREQEASPPGV